MPIAVESVQKYNEQRVCRDKGTICHAAESTMYFGRDGAVSACCYSRTSPLGRYPEQSVEEIWNGTVADSLRAALRRNEMPSGCELCADQIHAGNFTGLLANQFDQNARLKPTPTLISRVKSLFQIEQPKPFPVRLDFELSNKCNLECAMCSGFFSSSIRANREKLPALQQKYDSKFVQQLVPYLPHLTNAKFLGGEPFLIDIYYDIWEHLIELNPNCKVTITTNGTVFTDKVKRVLEKLNCEIVVSLDSVVKPTYENIRKNATLERTLANIDSFDEIIRRKNTGLSFAICPMVSNAEEIPGLVNFASERGAHVFFNTVVFPASHSIRALPTGRQREILLLFRASRSECHTTVGERNRDALEGLSRQIEFWISESDEKITPLRKRCAELIDSGSVPAPYRVVLQDLAHEGEHRQDDSFVTLEEADPVEKLKVYFRAVWYLGSLFERDNLLPGAHFDRDEEQIFLTHLADQIGPAQGRRIYSEIRYFPKTLLDIVGTTPASKLCELLDTHLAATH
jgi:MoaA/NifB/PqqE/SkfB family radical SAM enzyme